MKHLRRTGPRTYLGSLAVLLGTSLSAAAQEPVYQEDGGLLVIEFESAHRVDDWQLEESVAGYTGDAYLRWAGPDLFQSPGSGVFGFEFDIHDPGLYDFRIRNHHDHPDTTLENDVWVRMDGGPWIKVFSSVGSEWTWSTFHELAEDHKPPASYTLSEGRHRIDFSGRSFNFRLDRFHLVQPGTPNGLSPSQPESERIEPNRAPVARITMTPDALPSADNFQTVVTLDGTGSVDPDGDDISFQWSLRGGQFVQGTSPTSPVAKVVFSGGRTFPVRLVVTDPGGARGSAHEALNVEDAPGQFGGALVAHHPLEIAFEGPLTHEGADDPNPFLDHRLVVRFHGPDDHEFLVHGFYDGDGQGGSEGNVWKVRFAPPVGGLWTWDAEFRSAERAAIQQNLNYGTPGYCHGAHGSVGVLPADPLAEGFLAHGQLRYVGQRYLRHRDGTYFLKGGTDSPENLFGFAGFDGVQDQGGVGIIHHYEPHVQDFRPGDPLFVSATSGVDSRGLIGAMNYLSDQGVNSVYFLPMNLGGDGQETCPFVGYGSSTFDKRHYDVSRLHQWAQVFDHATRKGILMHLVLAETEVWNRNWLDNGAMGIERKLYFRELTARFGHVLGLKWNLSEENQYTPEVLLQMTDYLAWLDPYDHPIAVHTHPNDFSDYYELLGSPHITNTSIQYSPDLAGGQVEEWIQNSAQAGHPWVIDMDENGPWDTGLTDNNSDDLRKRVLYDVYFSGGQLEWYAGYHELPLGGDVKLEDFRTRQGMWRAMRFARKFLEENTSFWQMVPADDLVQGEGGFYGGAEVLAWPGRSYAIYLPSALGEGNLRLMGYPGLFVGRWYDPRTGEFAGEPFELSGGGLAPLPAPPSLVGEDWVLLVERP